MARTDVWDFYDSLPTGGGGRDGLTQAQRGVAAICDLRLEVNSGGFDAYFRYPRGDTAPDAVSVIGTALGPAWADLLINAMRVLGPEYSSVVSERSDRLDEPDVGTQLDNLDTQYQELENSDDADQLLTAYLARAGSN